MQPTLEELYSQVPVETVQEQQLAIASDLGLPVTAWQPISVAREVLYINAQLVSNFSIVTQVGAVAGGFLTYATGKWLTACAYQIFDTERIEATSATGKIRLRNNSGVPWTFGAGEARVLNETAQKTYTNQNGATIAAGAFSDLIEFVADEPGTSSNLTSGDTLSMVVTVPGAVAEFLENLIGQDEQSDPDLRTLSRQANAKASPNGPGDAYEYFAKTAKRPDGSLIGVTRTNKVEANGTVTMYLADADGALTSQDRDYVFDYINANVVPTGFTLFIPQPSCVENAIALAITVTPNPDSTATHADVEDRMSTAVAEYLATIDIGGAKAQSFQGVYLDTLSQVMRNAAGADVLNLVFTSPLADVPLTSPQAPVLASLTTTWTS